MSSRNLWIVVGLVVVLGVGAAWATGTLQSFFGIGSGDVATTGSGPNYVLTAHDRTLGNPKAPVVLIEYGAPSCPVCAAFNERTFPLVKQNYIDTGKVYYVFRVFPLRPDDGTAEKIARCLPADKYLGFIDLLFRNQPLWDVENGVTDVHGGLIKVARIAGISADQADKCMDNKAEDDTINKVSEDGDAKYHITGTPTLVLDGTSLGARLFTYDELSKLIDARLAQKKS